MIFLCLGFSLRVVAQGSCGQNTTWTLNNGMLVIEGSGDMTDWASPAVVPWYGSRNEITKVTIGEGVTSVGSFAFYDCRNLHSIALPNTMQRINDGACVWCSSLYTMTIPQSVTSISSTAFQWCYSLMDVSVDAANSIYSSEAGILFDKTKTTLLKYPENRGGSTYTIPSSVHTIGNHAFEHANNLSTVNIPSTVTTIGEMAFQSSSISSISIPASVTEIGDAAFNVCKHLTTIDVASGNASYSSLDGVLFDKSKQTLIQYPTASTATTYAIPDGVTSVSDCALRKSAKLETVTMPNSVTTFNKYLACWGTSINAYKYGDANNDIEINILDVLATLSIMKGQSDSFNTKAADANGDGSVNILDVLKILEIMKQR